MDNTTSIEHNQQFFTLFNELDKFGRSQTHSAEMKQDFFLSLSKKKGSPPPPPFELENDMQSDGQHNICWTQPAVLHFI